MPPRLTLLRGEFAGPAPAPTPVQLSLIIDGMPAGDAPCDHLDDEASHLDNPFELPPELAETIGQLDLLFDGLDHAERLRLVTRMTFNQDGTITAPPRLRLL